MKDKIEISKILFVIGIFIMGTAVFIDSFKVASLSGLKSGEKRLQIELAEKYDVEAPEKPLDESKYIIKPEAPGEDAAQEEQSKYEEALKDYENNVTKNKEEYEEELKIYNEDYKEYQIKKKEMSMEKARDSRENASLAKELDKDIAKSQLSVNEFLFSTILRFLGSIVVLIGSLGILLYGDNYERVGVLFVIGFGIKTIIGL